MADVLASEELTDEPSDFGSLGTGTRLGRYELLVPIARGGMARVWAARLHGQRGFQKLVALKTILPHLAKEAEFERMFLDEARIASGVHHPNVCEIYELGEDKNILYLAMEWVGGDSFARVLRPGGSGKTEPVDPRVVARVIADACAGLHAAHELTDDDGRNLGVVHRDLSPHNVLLTVDGVAKVADFGVAKALGQLHEATSAGQLKGKIAYMSPEQVTGAQVDRRSDVFSLGVVLYEATTGQRPFRGDGDHQVMHALLKGEFPAPTTIIRNYPPELERIVMRALAAQPILRFPSAERMRFSLEEFLARGHLVTQSHVAQLVRTRLGEQIDKRKDRIRQAGATGEAGFTTGGHLTPHGKSGDQQRSGVKQAPWHPPPGGSGPPPPMQQATPRTQPPAGPTGQTPNPGSVTVPHLGQYGPAGGPVPSFTPQPFAAVQVPQHQGMPPLAETVPRPLQSPLAGQGRMGPFASQPGFEVPNTDGGYGGPHSRPQAQAGATQYALAAGVGLLLALVIGTGGFLVWRAKRAVEGPSTAVSSESAPSAEIVFNVTPADATIIVDGQDTAKRSFPRPDPGKTVPVVVHAKGFEDQTLLVDYFTTSPKTVSLKALPEAKVEPPPADAPKPADVKPAEPPKPAPAARPRPVVAPPLPANPY